jgi:hypothetical protein
MMKLDSNLPDYVVGISASGEVDANDYETVLMPALDAALNKHERIRVLYQLTPEFTGFTSGAMWDDLKLGLEHLTAWDRIAVVTDLQWMAHATRMFTFLMPGEVKVFSNADLVEARRWIVA